jgi:putative phage-type endonuclease
MIENAKVKQGTPEWFEARRGKITGSRFKDVLSTRGNTRINYMRELLLERKTGKSAESYNNAEMIWGNATEPQARKYYEEFTGYKVEEVGFVDHPLEQYRGYVGVSPDGLVDTRGIIEIKCPNSSTHLDYMAKNKLPSTYLPQCQGNMWVTGRHWCDFISFDPRVDKEPFFCITVERDEEYIKKLAKSIDEFIQELVEMQKVSKTGIDPQEILEKTAGCSDEEWEKRKKEIDEKLEKVIEGKVRHGVVCAMIQAGRIFENDFISEDEKKYVNEFVDFIITGS